MKLKYAVVFEQTPNNYGAYVPDLPGCVSVGDTWEEMQDMIKEAITFHIEDMLECGEPLPQPQSSIEQAVAYHNQLLPEYVKESLAEFGEVADTNDAEFPPRFGMVEVEISVPESAEAV
ncbi:MAG: type II toxin-antitoxin system HicB family antitoxin [Rhodospirillaceae bacterium]|nr:type II toxin-antitoxin system HicB family antitoxin [Rhodospirillaceae bacterium]